MIPQEYKDVIHKEKKFTSKKAFIENEQLKKEYENRSHISAMLQEQQQFERDGIRDRCPDEDNDEEDLAMYLNETRQKPATVTKNIGKSTYLQRSNSAAGSTSMMSTIN